MGPRRSSNKKSKKGGKSRGSNHPQPSEASWNFVREAGPGCHIARIEHGNASWVLEWESVHPDEYEIDETEGVPDLAVDPDEQTLTLCNLREDPVVAYITVYGNALRGKNGISLKQGSTTDKEGQQTPCTTLIILCPAYTFAHLCYVDMDASSPSTVIQDLQIDSDVQVWNRHTKPDDEHEHPIGFPLQGGPFLCTQGEGGHLTHFFAGNQHAIDFQCPKGTPLLAVGDGEVVQAQDKHEHLSGIAVSNLFSWNSILLRLDPLPSVPLSSSQSGGKEKAAADTEHNATVVDALFVEYVHISSCQVKVGDRVSKGQVIGTSGGIGK